jgi:hypothetical protein
MSLHRKTWARAVTTTYEFNNAGDRASVAYTDATPTVTNTIDRLGRRTGIVSQSPRGSRMAFQSQNTCSGARFKS